MSRVKTIITLVFACCIVLLFYLFLHRGGQEDTETVTTQTAPRHPSLPLVYAIGEIDSRFGVTRERVKELADEARKIWEAGAGRELMQYDEESPFKVNLIFDWRQEKLLAARKDRAGLDEHGRSFDNLQDDYNRRSGILETSRAALDESARSFQSRLDEYNTRVARWNEGGERSESDQRYLQSRQSELEAERTEINSKRSELNLAAEELNKLGDTLNQMAEKFNFEVDKFNGTYIRSRDFEKGVFDGSSINVYEFEKEDDLKITLIHEFGHALGLGHTENPTSIMHRKLALQDLNNIQLTAEDLAALRGALKE